MNRVVAAGLAGAALSGVPSTVVTLARGESLLDGVRAAGAIALPRETRTPVLVAAAVPVHLALSLGWAAVLDARGRRARCPVSRSGWRSRRSTSRWSAGGSPRSGRCRRGASGPTTRPTAWSSASGCAGGAGRSRR